MRKVLSLLFVCLLVFCACNKDGSDEHFDMRLSGLWDITEYTLQVTYDEGVDSTFMDTTYVSSIMNGKIGYFDFNSELYVSRGTSQEVFDDFFYRKVVQDGQVVLFTTDDVELRYDVEENTTSKQVWTRTSYNTDEAMRQFHRMTLEKR